MVEGKRIGFVGIIIEDRRRAAVKVNEILSRYGDGVIARMGVPYRARGCHVITLAVEMTTDDLGALTGQLGGMEGVTVKSALAR